MTTTNPRFGRLLFAVGATALTFSAVSLAAQDAAPAPTPPEKKGWETSADAGLTLTRGNSSTALGTLSLQSNRKWTQQDVNLGASFTYGEVDGVKNTEVARAFGQYNRIFDERIYGGLRLEILHDDIADIDYRVTLSPLAGYYVVKNPTTRLAFEAGPSFIYEKQGGDETGYLALRLAERFEHNFNERTKLWQSAEYLPQVDDFQNYIVNAEIGIETALTKKFHLKTYLQDTYDNEPAPGRKKNDLKLVTAIGYTF